MQILLSNLLKWQFIHKLSLPVCTHSTPNFHSVCTHWKISVIKYIELEHFITLIWYTVKLRYTDIFVLLKFIGKAELSVNRGVFFSTDNMSNTQNIVYQGCWTGRFIVYLYRLIVVNNTINRCTKSSYSILTNSSWTGKRTENKHTEFVTLDPGSKTDIRPRCETEPCPTFTTVGSFFCLMTGLGFLWLRVVFSFHTRNRMINQSECLRLSPT